MLSFRFQLTPAQVDFLLLLYAGKYKPIGERPSSGMLPDSDSPHFVGIFRKLESKGLASHCPKRNPTYLITEQGKAVAEMIVREAKRIAAIKFIEVTPAECGKAPKIGGKVVKSEATA